MEQFLPTGQEALVTEGEVNEGQELKLHQESLNPEGEKLSMLLTIGLDIFQCRYTLLMKQLCLAGTLVEMHWAYHVTFHIIQPFQDS